MSFFIDSNDFTNSNNAFDARYQLPKSVSGLFQLKYQYYGPSFTVNWCNSTNNQLRVARLSFPELGTKDIFFGNMSSYAPADIVVWLNNGWKQLYDQGFISGEPVTVYDAETDRYTTTLSEEVYCVPFLPSEVYDVNDLEDSSTIASLFGWTPNAEGVIFDNPTTEVVISGQNFGGPAHNILEVICPQMRNKICNTNSIDNMPSFILSLTEAIEGQKIEISSPTDVLDLTFIRPGTLQNVHYSGYFLLFFVKISL